MKGNNQHIVYLLLGGNLGDRLALFSETRKALSIKIGRIGQTSSVYSSEPWGMPPETNWFYNQALKIETSLTPESLLEGLLSIEQSLGRKKRKDLKNHYESRLIDIDLLYYDQEIIELNHLVIPHPRVHLRRFALEAMNEINPSLVHPKLNYTQAELLNKCDDQGKVTKI
ncbi:MAG: 2-amino-4-hydroxy-6-hydroxymethyldihydropteridine diphosphokinase [Salibacteraceae bacterium]